MNKPNVKPQTTDLLKLAAEAKKQEAAEHKAKEEGKQGILRGGNTGALISGQVLGKCHRLSLLRMLGIDRPKDASSYYYFDLGYANEDVWYKRLARMWKGVIKREEEIPVVWQTKTDSGKEVTITGRPDVVLCDENGNPQEGIEHKAIVAVNSAASVLSAGKPKTDHILQAGHYSWRLGIPFTLLYTIYAKGSAFAKGKGKLAVSPQDKTFQLGWDDGNLTITSGTTTETTAITAQGIEDYYKLVAEMAEEKFLYQRFPSLDYNLDPMPYSQCNYCPFKSACDKYEGNYDRWVDESRRISEEGSNDESEE